MTMQVIVSQEAEGSLELIQRLAAVGEVNHLGDGFYTIEATDNQVYDLVDQQIALEQAQASSKLDEP